MHTTCKSVEIEEKLVGIENVKCLALEHHMAAKRLGFATFFEPLYGVDKYKQGVGNAIFDTHQGVKGLQFDRVMVVIDDVQAQGTTFNYGKLFGTVPKSKTDIENEQKGKESTIDRTRRLLYVTCSRAIDSLAIVFYSDSVETDASQIENSGWFLPAEIVKMTDEMQNATND